MARTLNDIANEEGRTWPERLVIKTIKETSKIWNFLNIEDRKTGVSLIDQNVTLPNTDLRNFNANYSDSVAPVVEQVTTNLYPLGGKHQIDKKLKSTSEARTGKNYLTDQLGKYAQSAGLNAKKHMLFNPSWGLDAWANVYQDRGYETRIAVDTAPQSLYDVPLAQFIAAMNHCINLGNGIEGLIILLDREVFNILHGRLLTEAHTSELAKYLEFQTGKDSNGNLLRNWATWGGIPMLDMGYDADRARIIRPIYGDGDDETKIYFLNTGEQQSAFLQDRAPEVELIPQNGVFKEFSLDWLIGMEVKDPDAIRTLEGLTLEVPAP